MLKIYVDLLCAFFQLIFTNCIMLKVLYDDGDIEVLCLDKERWKLVGNGHKLAEV